MQVPGHMPGGTTGRAGPLPAGAARGPQGPGLTPSLPTAGSAGAAAAALGSDHTQVPVQHPVAYNTTLAALDPRNSYLPSAASSHTPVPPTAAPTPRPPQPPPMPPGLPATPAALSTFGAAAATAAAALQPGATPFAALQSATSTSLQHGWRPDHQLLSPTASLGSATPVPVPAPAPPPGNPPGALSQSWSLSTDALKALPEGVAAPVIKLPPAGARRLPDPEIATWCRRLEANRVALAVSEHEHAATEVKLQEATLLVRRAEELRCMTNPVWQYLDDTDEQICGPYSLMQLAHVLRAAPQTQIESIDTGESVPFVEAMARTPLREAVVARNALREELAAAEARVCVRLAEVS